jgi:hypothetical protein
VSITIYVTQPGPDDDCPRTIMGLLGRPADDDDDDDDQDLEAVREPEQAVLTPPLSVFSTYVPPPEGYPVPAAAHDKEADVKNGASGRSAMAMAREVVFYGVRPHVGRLIDAAIAATPADGRVLVLGCGPPTLMDAVRTGTHIATCGPGVELHMESFGW